MSKPEATETRKNFMRLVGKKLLEEPDSEGNSFE